MRRTIPDLWVEQYALGELSDARRRQVEEALGESLPARLEALRTSDEAVLAGLPPRVFASRVAAAGHAPPTRRWRALVPVAVAALALGAALPLLQSDGDGLEITRAKGAPMLQIHRRLGDDAELLRDGDVARPGDVLQVSYTSGGAEFGAVGSLDGNGVITWHLPLNGERSAHLQPGSAVPLAESYELDDAPRHERFFLVTSPGDFRLEDVEDAVRDWEEGADLELIPPMKATVFEVSKGGVP